VDPESTEIIELGTKAFPYKNIGLPFVEILNYHSHSERTINIYLKEYTENLLLWKSNYIINITQVNVETYSTTNIGVIGRADILIKMRDVVMLTSKTVFNIMKHTTLLLDENLPQDQIPADEISISNFKFYL
jgi:hypothetical protein